MTLWRHLRELLVALAIVLLAMLVAPAPPVRAATFTPAALVSYQGSTQATNAYQPAISGDGQEVAFVGTFDGVQGVWDKDLASGALSLVAGQQAGGLAAFNAADAGSPSLSADGRYVAFTTTADLDPADDPQPGASCSNVYVRDMDAPIGSAGAYTLVSALDDSGTGLGYQLNAGGTACAAGGSASADRVAISADGNEVAFTVMGQSDLSSGTAADPTTPPDQVAVRDIAQRHTMLVSQTMASEHDGGTPQPVPGGAAVTTANDAITYLALTTDFQQFEEPISASSAAISADGSTVAWLGTDIPEQAPAAAADAGTQFDEPLWRQITLGAGAPTRRVTGGDDPAAPDGQGPFDETYNAGNPATEGETASALVTGTYQAVQGFGGTPQGQGQPPLDVATPQLSANGQEVAFLSDDPLNGQEPVAAVGQGWAPVLPNAYVVNMAAGLTRGQALTRVTEVASGAVTSVAISPSGTSLAFTTADIAFSLSWPTLVTPPLSSAVSLTGAQLYDVDLTAGTVSLASYGYDGNPANGLVTQPSFTTGGDTIAFASAATNLFYGAQNDGTDVFTLTENTSPAIPGTVAISPPVQASPLIPTWLLSVTATPTVKGTVRLAASVPGAGTLSATVKTVHVPGGPRIRQIASGRVRAGRARILRLTLKPGKAYDARMRKRTGLLTTVRVSFTAAGHATLTKTLQVTLHQKTPKRKKVTAKRKATKKHKVTEKRKVTEKHKATKQHKRTPKPHAKPARPSGKSGGERR